MTKRRAFDRLKQEDEEVKLPPPASEAKRDRSWEREHNKTAVTYRNIPVELREAIKRAAQALGVPVDDAARAFLEYGLAAYESGALSLEPRPEATRLRLFPREAPKK